MTHQKHRTAEDQDRWQAEQAARTKGGRQVGLACSQGSMTWIGTDEWRTEAEAHVVDVCDLVTQHHGSDAPVLQGLVSELTAPSATVD